MFQRRISEFQTCVQARYDVLISNKDFPDNWEDAIIGITMP